MSENVSPTWPRIEYEQPLIVDGQFEGYRMRRLPLSDLVPGEVTGVYFSTGSGNTYAIYYPRMSEGDDVLAMIGLKGNRGRGRNVPAYHFTGQEIQDGILELARPFRYGRGGRTTIVTEIVFLTGRQGTPHEDAASSDVRSRFWRRIKGGGP